MYENLNTLLDCLYNSQKQNGDKPFLKYRENENYIPISYNDFIKMMDSMAGALYDIGVRKNDKIGIISENMYKWLITDMAIISLGATDVPRGSDSTVQELLYILEHSEAKYCFVENSEQADKVLSITSQVREIKCIILLTGNISEVTANNPNDVEILQWDEMHKKGYDLFEKNKTEIEEIRQNIQPDDVVTIIYTSGTTGRPKGVMLKHKNIMHNIRVLPDVIHITSNERWMSILPVWHVFERTLEYIIMATSGTMGYSKPQAKHLLPDFADIKPTFMVSVPRIWEALYQGIVNKVKADSAVKWAMFRFFIGVGKLFLRSKKVLLGLEPLFKKRFFLVTLFKKKIALITMILLWFWYVLGDLLVFKKIRAKTGGCLRGPVSGGGALPSYIDEFFAVIKVDILEGWGLTETAPVIGVRLFERLTLKTVGPPAPGIELKICDENGNPLPNQHEKGIVFVRGDNVMSGYYKDPERTKAVLSDDGWFNTGDLGRMTLKGDLQLTGRAKDTIVLVGGENIEPQPIEDVLLEDSLIYQIMVVGQDKKVLGAVIIPAEEYLMEFADKAGIEYKDFQDLCDNPNIENEFKERIKEKINTKNGFRDYERITFIKLIPEPFEIGKELTHSLKMKRNIIADKYAELIEGMFK